MSLASCSDSDKNQSINKQVIIVEETCIVDQDTSDQNDIKFELIENHLFGQGNEIINDWKPELFTELTEKEFLEIRKGVKPSYSHDSSSIKFTDSLFTIQTSRSQLTFNHKRKSINRGWKWMEYNGFIEVYKLYLVTHWFEGSILTGYMIMIDKKKGTQYSVTSVSDGPCELPLVSEDKKFMMVYSHNYHYSNITILERIEEKGEKGNFREVISFSLNGIVQEPAWTGENKISFKLNNRQYFDKNFINNVCYIANKPIDKMEWKRKN